MRIDRLRLVNFRQHRDTDIELGPGLTGIIGPNGAGKTTLLEAIAWAIYGNKAARGGRDSIRWRRAKPRSEVRVELIFTLGPHTYRVVRTLFGAELFLDGGAQPIVSSVTEVTDRLTRILRMTREEFYRTYFTGQKDLAAMAALKPTDRRLFLNRLLGYHRLREAQELARRRRSELASELDGLSRGWPDPAALHAERQGRAAEARASTQKLKDAEDRQAATKSASDQHLPVFKGMKEYRERHQALGADRRVAQEQLRAAVDETVRLEGELAAAESSRAELAMLAPRIVRYQSERAILIELDVLAKDAETRSRLETQLEEMTRRIDEIRARLEQARQGAGAALEAAQRLEKLRGELETTEQVLKERSAAWVREKADADASRRQLLDHYKDLETQKVRVVEAGETGACPTCGRPLGGEYHAVLDLLEGQIAKVVDNGQYFRSKLDSLQASPDDVLQADARRHQLAATIETAAQELAVARRAANEAMELDKEKGRLEERRTQLAVELNALRPGYDRERHESVRTVVHELEADVRKAERLGALAERATPLADQRSAAEARRAELVDRLATIERELAGLEFDEEAFLKAEREMERLERAWREAESTVTTARAEATLARERLLEAERREQEAAERKARSAEVQRELRLHHELDRAIDDLSADLNAEIGPELSSLAGEFLSSLTDGQFDEVQLDEEFEATLYEDGEPQPVVSGGEEDLTNLVLRLAVSQMIADRAGQPLSLLVLDEIFGSLDDVRQARVMHLLRGLSGRFPQVVLITHVENVRETLDRVLRVRYDEASGAAIVSEERGPTMMPPGGADNAHVAA
ncbi:MAG: AAA family ATPase [Gemmatimonadales bacterium]